MKLTIELNQQQYKVLVNQPTSIAIDLAFIEASATEHLTANKLVQPNHFGADYAQASSMKIAQFIGDTRVGGSCNVTQITMNPHCNGTHTECVGHIVHNPISINQTLNDSLIPCTLISVTPTPSQNQSKEQYDPSIDEGDKLITKQQLMHQIQHINNECLTALVIRTLPNEQSKQRACYSEHNQPPYFTNDAIEYLNERGVTHLLVDMPSIDKMFDQGHMSNHHIFWQVAPLARLCGDDTQLSKSITEMVYVGNTLEDGLYLLNLQIAPFELDAAPSRPLLYSLQAI
ncbi:cyclase family protein [Flocculibacter collagenilyticus]|uniref:cyclase family protein n=1 Tax=Flocculibacter collagenilyticus TaxID=2744479 RepID=UPI0018F28E92|nr:cyclase family protein [Flocculibacter collagenilyticus]